MDIPILGFAGYSGSGKTTLIEKLIPLLKARGYRLAVIKHDGHHFEIDKEGKDSWRFSQVGAEMVILSSREKSAVIDHRELSLEDTIAFIHDVDLILVEGWKDADIPHVGICRKANGKGLPAEASHFLALVTDEPLAESSVPVFGLNDAQGLADYIEQELLKEAVAYYDVPSADQCPGSDEASNHQTDRSPQVIGHLPYGR